MYKKFIKDKSGNKAALYDKYKTYRNRLTSVLRAAEKSYYASKLLNERDNLRKVWQTINKIIGKSSSSTSIKEIEQSGVNITDSTKIAENFNRYFSNIGSSLAKSIAPSSCKATDYLKVNTPDSLFLSPITPSEIIDQIALIKNSYSKGCDDIATLCIRVIKHSANELSSILAEIFNQSLEQEVFP